MSSMLLLLMVPLAVGCIMQFAFGVNVLHYCKVAVNKTAHLIARLTDPK